MRWWNSSQPFSDEPLPDQPCVPCGIVKKWPEAIRGQPLVKIRLSARILPLFRPEIYRDAMDSSLAGTDNLNAMTERGFPSTIKRITTAESHCRRSIHAQQGFLVVIQDDRGIAAGDRSIILPEHIPIKRRSVHRAIFGFLVVQNSYPSE